MNVQLSLSASTSLQPQTQSQGITNTNNATANQESLAKDIMSLTEKERQGVKVSIGEEPNPYD